MPRPGPGGQETAGGQPRHPVPGPAGHLHLPREGGRRQEPRQVITRVTRIVSSLPCTRSEPGRQEHALCRCSHVVPTRAQVTVTRATCCTPGQGGLNKRVPSQLVTCPPHLPHVSRYRSSPCCIYVIVIFSPNSLCLTQNYKMFVGPGLGTRPSRVPRPPCRTSACVWVVMGR